MHQVFVDAWREARTRRGPWGRAAFLAGMVVDLIWHIALAWWEPLVSASGPPQRSRAGAWAHPAGTPPPRRYLMDVRQDVRTALRGFRKRPAFTALAVSTVALGIGSVTSIFSVFHAVLLAPLPYRDADRLVAIWGNTFDPATGQGDTHFATSPVQYHAWREDSRTLVDVATHGLLSASFGPVGEESLPAAYGSASWNFFDVLGVEPSLGRLFDEGDDPIGPEADVAVLSHGYWMRTFGGDPGAIGRSLAVDGRTHTIIGVLPRGFRWLESPEEPSLWVPRYLNRGADGGTESMIGRMGPDVALEDVAEDLGRFPAARAAERQSPLQKDPADWITVEPYREVLLGDSRPGIVLLLGAVGFVLLLACVNTAHLLLAQGVARRRELAVRSSLGAGRARLSRQLFVEAIVLAGLGFALGIPFAFGGVKALQMLAPPDIPRLEQATLDGVVLTVSLAVTLASGLLFGLLPAIRASRPDLARALAEGGGVGSGGSSAQPITSGLVVGQFASAVVVVAGAALLVHSLVNLLTEDIGVEPEGVWVARVRVGTPEELPYVEPLPIPYGRRGRTWVRNTEANLELPARLVERLGADARVAEAAVGTGLPLSGGFTSRSPIRPGEAGPPPPETEEPDAWVNYVEPGFFEVLRIPLLEGRTFSPADTREGAPLVAVVSRAIAQRYWPRGDAVGSTFPWHRYQLSSTHPAGLVWSPVQVIGVVGDVQDVVEGVPGMGFGAGPTLAAYLLRSQTEDTIPAPFRRPVFHLFVRPSSEAVSVREAVVDALAATAPAATLLAVQPLSEVTGQWVRTPRFYALLLGSFGAACTLLSAVGIAGVMAIAVGHRKREMAIRLVMGSTPAAVLRLVLRGTTAPAVLGIVLGLGVTLVLTRFLESQLHELGRNDPLTLAGVVGFMLSVAAVSAWIPARSVTRVEPARVLRLE